MLSSVFIRIIATFCASKFQTFFHLKAHIGRMMRWSLSRVRTGMGLGVVMIFVLRTRHNGQPLCRRESYKWRIQLVANFPVIAPSATFFRGAGLVMVTLANFLVIFSLMDQGNLSFCRANNRDNLRLITVLEEWNCVSTML